MWLSPSKKSKTVTSGSALLTTRGSKLLMSRISPDEMVANTIRPVLHGASLLRLRTTHGGQTARSAASPSVVIGEGLYYLETAQPKKRTHLSKHPRYSRSAPGSHAGSVCEEYTASPVRRALTDQSPPAIVRKTLTVGPECPPSAVPSACARRTRSGSSSAGPASTSATRASSSATASSRMRIPRALSRLGRPERRGDPPASRPPRGDDPFRRGRCGRACPRPARPRRELDAHWRGPRN